MIGSWRNEKTRYFPLIRQIKQAFEVPLTKTLFLGKENTGILQSGLLKNLCRIGSGIL